MFKFYSNILVVKIKKNYYSSFFRQRGKEKVYHNNNTSIAKVSYMIDLKIKSVFVFVKKKNYKKK